MRPLKRGHEFKQYEIYTDGSTLRQVYSVDPFSGDVYAYTEEGTGVSYKRKAFRRWAKFQLTLGDLGDIFRHTFQGWGNE